jgi:hypothetical protein
MNKQFLEEQLIDFAILILNVSNNFEKNHVVNHIAGQTTCLGTFSALNDIETQRTKSIKDLTQKRLTCLKELRKSFVFLKTPTKSNLTTDLENLTKAKKKQMNLYLFLFQVVKHQRGSSDIKKLN